MNAYRQQTASLEKVRPEIAAVISAVVAACMENSGINSYHIAAIRPAANISRRWVLRGRHELMNNGISFERKCMAV